jgi:hypothetical protein
MGDARDAYRIIAGNLKEECIFENVNTERMIALK